MLRTVGKLVLVLLLVAFAGVALALFRSEDPRYIAKEWLSLGRYARYDAMIGEAARKHGIDPLLLKAVVWRESEFHPGKTGKSGERGLMQVGSAAAADWVRVNKVQTFVETDLFSPRMNLEVGAWYLKRALDRWGSRDDPEPFALAEYNAGKSRVDRWIEKSGRGADATADDLRPQIDFPTTRAYVEKILERREFYRQRERW